MAAAASMGLPGSSFVSPQLSSAQPSRRLALSRRGAIRCSACSALAAQPGRGSRLCARARARGSGELLRQESAAADSRDEPKPPAPCAPLPSPLRPPSPPSSSVAPTRGSMQDRTSSPTHPLSFPLPSFPFRNCLPGVVVSCGSQVLRTLCLPSEPLVPGQLQAGSCERGRKSRKERRLKSKAYVRAIKSACWDAWCVICIGVICGNFTVLIQTIEKTN